MVMRSSSLDRTRQFFSARRDATRASGRLPPGWLGVSRPGRPELAGAGELSPGPELLALGAALVAGTGPPTLPAGLRAAAWGALAGREPGRAGVPLRLCLTRDGTVSGHLTR